MLIYSVSGNGDDVNVSITDGSGTWSAPFGYQIKRIQVWGGGGGGGAASSIGAQCGSGGGGAGGYASVWVYLSHVVSITYSVGAASTFGVAGNSSVVSWVDGSISAGGGDPGEIGGASVGAGGAGGTGDIVGDAGDAGNVNGNGGNGGGPFGGTGGTYSNNAGMTNGGVYGGGGGASGSSTAYDGGAGGHGLIIITYEPTFLHIYQMPVMVLGGVVQESSLRITKVDAELYSTIPHVILKPLRVTKVDAELYSTVSQGGSTGVKFFFNIF